MKRMNEIDLNTIYSTSLRLFTILKEEYSLYLSEEKRSFLETIDVFHFYKIIKEKELPPIQYIGETYYLNSYYQIDFMNYLPFICLSTLCGSLNPLKIGLMEEELKLLKEKYALKYVNHHEKETEVADVVSKTLLEGIPNKVIFLDTDSDIVSYLVEEKGSKVALFYFELSKKMKKIKNNHQLEDYSEVLDSLYEFVSSKIR